MLLSFGGQAQCQNAASVTELEQAWVEIETSS